MTYFGRSLKRFEDPRLLRGQGAFVDDITLPNQLYAHVMRSPHAHAAIRSVDPSAALAHPDVVAVFSGADVVETLGNIPTRSMTRGWAVDEIRPPEHPVLAFEKAFYVGQPVAVVVARSRYAALDGAELVVIDYQPLEPVVDPHESSTDNHVLHEGVGTNVAMRVQHEGGEVDEAFANAHRVISDRFQVQRLAPAPMEARGIVAQYDAGDDQLMMWNSTQVPHRVRDGVARVLGRSQESTRVIAPDVGGGFGEKDTVFPEDVLIPYLALTLGQPIKWVEDRQENMVALHARGHYSDVDAAVAEDGTLLAMKVSIVADLGAFFLVTTPSVPFLASHRLVGPYRTPAMRVNVRGVITNKPPTGPYRGAGGPEAAFCMERTMDLVAAELGMDPAHVRRINLIHPDSLPYTTPTGVTYDSGNYEVGLDRALEMSEYAQWRARAAEPRKPGEPLLGVGLATVLKASGAYGEVREDSSRVMIDAAGQVTVHIGASPHGQGTETTFSQMGADELGLIPEDLTIIHSDTAVVAKGGGTSASRGTVVSGSAMVLAMQQAREKMGRIAAQLLDCSPDDLEFQDRSVTHRSDPTRVTTFADVASAAYDEERLPPGEELGLDFSLDYVLPNNPYAFAAHVAVVEVDPGTGDVRIIKYFAVHDCGNIINPMIVEAQLHGGIVQGLGQAMVEGIEYDSNGQLVTGSLLDYSLPVAADMPDFQMDTMETPSPLTPHGAKGIGELPTVATPVVLANAVMNALASAGVKNVDTPLTPNRVMEALLKVS
jgi:carbon-monoxide dehydrogenase large subunit